MNVRYTEVALRELDDILAFIASNYPTASQLYGTHSLRRIKATLLYRRTWNLRAVQLLLGHRRIETTVRYLGIKADDALPIAEQVEI